MGIKATDGIDVTVRPDGNLEAYSPALRLWDECDSSLNKALVSSFSSAKFCKRDKEISDEQLTPFFIDLCLTLMSELGELVKELVDDDYSGSDRDVLVGDSESEFKRPCHDKSTIIYDGKPLL
jgi:hypothetical protein